MKNVNLQDFDFTLPVVARSYKGRTAVADVCVSVGVKGKNRKNNNNNIVLSGFFKRTDAAYQSFMIGVNKFSKRVNAVIAFSPNKGVGQQAVNIGYNKASSIWYASSKGMVKKIYDIFGIQIPDVPGTSTRFYFDLEPTDTSKVYQIAPVLLERVDAFGNVSRVDLERAREKENKLPNGDTEPLARVQG